ncbi:unnamed protein product [Closterium sp. NIES-65]|nr:unnamed protein product [Closterium sp. NIES-65]
MTQLTSLTLLLPHLANAELVFEDSQKPARARNAARLTSLTQTGLPSSPSPPSLPAPLIPTPPLAIHPSPCHPPLPLPSTPPLAIHPSSCHPPFLLPSTLPLAIHPSSCHPPFLLPSTLPLAIHPTSHPPRGTSFSKAGLTHSQAPSPPSFLPFTFRRSSNPLAIRPSHTFHEADRSARSVSQGPSPPSSPPLNRPTDPFPSPSPFRATPPTSPLSVPPTSPLSVPRTSPHTYNMAGRSARPVPLHYLSVFFISSHTPLFRQLLSCLSTPHTSPYRPALLCIVSYRSESFCRRLDSNQFTGSIPSGLSKLTALTVLSVPNNLLTGSLPATLSALRRLVSMQLSNNSLSGSLPSALSTLTNLRNLYSRQQQQAIWIAPFISQILSRNTLSGSIPSDYSALEFLAILLLNNNFIIGTIPSSLSTLSYLYQVDVSENLLSGTLPSMFTTNMTDLRFFNVAFNSLSGSLPKSLSNLQSLYSLDLSNNYFSGQVQTIFSALTSLQSINISYNYFSGYLPKIGFLGELKSTDLSNNFFFGSANDGTDSIGLPLCPDPPTSSYTIAQNCLLNLANTCTAISGLTVSFVEAQKTEDECFVFCGTSLAMPIFPNQQCGYEKGMCVANLSGSGVLFYQCQCTAPFVRSADAKSCDLPLPVHGDPDTARQPQWPQQRGYEKGMCVASLSGDGVLFYQCHQPTTATAISARAPPTLPSPLPTSKIASSFPTVTSEPPS